jgi:pimeloyl-ACP methyl ester carboxylesterase
MRSFEYSGLAHPQTTHIAAFMKPENSTRNNRPSWLQDYALLKARILAPFRKQSMIVKLLWLAVFILSAGTYSLHAAETARVRGERIDVGGYKINSVFVPATRAADLPPIVFIHGASANLYDPMGAFLAKLKGRADLLFIDRPGHGHSDRGGNANDFPDGQADAIAAIMNKRGIRKAIIVSHSFGGAVAATFALNHKDMVAGLLFLSPAVYPFGDDVAWYYRAAKAPVTGWLFSGLVAPTIGLASVDLATRAVFAPNPRPANYIARAHILLATRPSDFRHNAIDIANLDAYLKKASPRYPAIHAPTIIITGDRDGIVSPRIHSHHLAHDIKGSKLIRIHNLGHKPDYIVTDVAVAALEQLAGKKRSLVNIAKQAEHRVASDR